MSNRFREEGIDANIDQYSNPPSEGWQRWMLTQVAESEFVIVICTKTYDRRFNGKEEIGKGKGVTWEGAIIMQDIYDSQGRNSKFIPVIFDSKDSEFIPIPLRSTTLYDLSSTDNGYDELYRRLTKQDKNPRPILGSKRYLPPHKPKKFVSPRSTGSRIDFSWQDLRELIKGLYETLSKGNSGTSRFDLSDTDMHSKNELNNMGANYFKMMVDYHEPYFAEIERFLGSPANSDIKGLYHEIVDELRSKLACCRDDFENFETFLIQFADVAKHGNQEAIDRKPLNVLLSFMYMNCDIGSKQ